jgi:xanthine phosphoribosyltransferase
MYGRRNMTASPELAYLPYEGFVSDIDAVVARIEGEASWRPDYIIGIGRGGLVPSVYISHHMGVPMLSIDYSAKVYDFADDLLIKVARKSSDGSKFLFVDDINDSGTTIDHIRAALHEAGCAADNLRFAVLINNRRSKVEVNYWARMIDREVDKQWFVFPWEAVGTRETIVEEAQSVPERLA